MGIIHTVLPFKDGGLRGIQACQRDWSNYLVHFTCAAAMHTLKKFPCTIKFSPKTLAKKIEAADKESFKVVKKNPQFNVITTCHAIGKGWNRQVRMLFRV